MRMSNNSTNEIREVGVKKNPKKTTDLTNEKK